MKPLHWIGSAKRDLLALPEDVQSTFGYALFLAQTGGKHDQAKPLKGFGSAGVLEVVESEAGSTYRAVYTVKIAGAVYVLHCFQKKSSSGVATPKPDMDLVRERLKVALAHAGQAPP
ncbi:MAG: type II toxin-antitoxin system RelE/ParE family toxin [Polaromonas sp.]|nr:type II toxin-antitoxin system RelE/ParE family toxin [Polaromonas sp.]